MSPRFQTWQLVVFATIGTISWVLYQKNDRPAASPLAVQEKKDSAEEPEVPGEVLHKLPAEQELKKIDKIAQLLYGVLEENQLPVLELESQLKTEQNRYTEATKRYLLAQQNLLSEDREKTIATLDDECSRIREQYRALQRTYKDLAEKQAKRVKEAGFDVKPPKGESLLRSVFPRYPEYATEWNPTNSPE